jgi:hypothetical protein
MKLGSPGFPEQRKLGMCVIIEGLKYSNRQIFQNVTQGNNPEKTKNITEIICSISIMFNSQDIRFGCCFSSSFRFSNGHLRADAASAGGFAVSPPCLASR